MFFFRSSSLRSQYYDVGVLFLAAVVLVCPIYFFGIPNGNDLPQHYQFAQTYYESLQNGVLYPSWSALANSGFGDLGVRCYPPLSYYVLCFFRWISGNWYEASALTFGFWFFVGGIGVYFWSREAFGANASLFSGIIYMVLPYHANQIYNAFLYAEFAAAAILPFCFLFATRICRDQKWTDVIALGIFYALLILTHLPMAIIGSIALGVYSVAMLQKGRFYKAIGSLSSALGLGAGASLFFWLRMVSELPNLRHATNEFVSSVYDFHSNFLLSYFYTPATQYFDRALWLSDLLLAVTVVMSLPLAASCLIGWKTANKRLLIAATLVLAVALVLSTPVSLPVWERVRLLREIQFPWRWMGVITLVVTVFIAAGFENIPGLFRTKWRPVAILAVGLVFAGTVFTMTQIMRPAVYLNRGDFDAVVAMSAHSKSFESWWPVWAKPEALLKTEKAQASGRDISIEQWIGTTRKFKISPGDEPEVRIATFYHPYWKALVNETPVEPGIAGDGTILIPLPREAADIRLWFEEPIYFNYSWYVSLAAWVLFAMSFFVRGQQIFLSKKSQT